MCKYEKTIIKVVIIYLFILLRFYSLVFNNVFDFDYIAFQTTIG